MESIQEQIESIEQEMAKTPYHKGTEGWFGLMRAKIAKMRAQIAEKQLVKAQQGGGRGFAIKKFGNATVVLVGFPSVGKSTLLNALTNAKSPTAEYAFTTVTVIPGMMDYNNAQIQILDVPGLIEGASAGKGKGREVLSVVRSADLLLIMGDTEKYADQFERIVSELEANGVRINQERPQVVVKKALRGGLKINFTVGQDLNRYTISGVAKEFGIINAEFIIKEKLTLDRLVDAFATNRVYVPALFVVNKIDKQIYTPEVQVQKHFRSETATTHRDFIGISAENEIGLDGLREKVWETLGLIRVYLRDPKKSLGSNLRGGGTNMDCVIMHKGQTLQDLLDLLGPDAAIGKTEAKIWGTGARFPGQTVSFRTKVQDGLEVTFI